MPFVDETELELASGHGGAGAASFRREKYVPKGGPDGGDGGRGGDVIFTVRDNLKTLAHLSTRHRLRAEDGKPGEKRRKHGKDGAPVIVEVPPGTLIRDAESGKILKDLSEEREWVYLTGGKGGRGNTWFKSSTRQAPRYAQSGLPGQSARVRIELQLIADVGFVGKPNAGKSTLLDVLTNARPEIAAYPFTTKIPNLGVLKIGYQEIVLADIPGLIGGAADGVGLGHRFLKHVRRTRALALAVDMGGDDPVDDLRVLLDELGRYDQTLLNKPRFVIGTKMDLPDAAGRASTFSLDSGDGKHGDVVFVSAHRHQGLDELIETLKRVCSEA